MSKPLIPGHQPLRPETMSAWGQHSVRSRLAAARKHRGVSQIDLARAVGMSLASYRRLETGEMENPGLRYLVNCALALDIELTALIEDEWLEWAVLEERAPTQPPDPRELWRPRQDPPARPPP
ncbi:MAG: helix-turn-helix domain-containing protein [Thermoleophilaceae bacterium]